MPRNQTTAPPLPVPAAAPTELADRHDGWTKPKMCQFIEALAETGSVAAAARSIGMSRQSAYRLRARLNGQPFDLAWEAALEFGLQQLAHAALDRALNGVPVPVFARGELIGERRHFDERLTMFLLANPGRVGRQQLARDAATREWVPLMQRISSGPVVWTPAEKKAAAKKEEAAGKFAESETHYVMRAPSGPREKPDEAYPRARFL